MAVWLAIVGWEFTAAATSERCVIDHIAGREVRATCDGTPRAGTLQFGVKSRRAPALQHGDPIRRSSPWGGFRRDGLLAGYSLSLCGLWVLAPVAYLSGRLLRPPSM